MAAVRRLLKEITELKAAEFTWLFDVQLVQGNIMQWKVWIMPQEFPYNLASFWLEILFAPEHPFKPPKVRQV